ncbi:hypothetical protein [Trichloromonas sp.]
MRVETDLKPGFNDVLIRLKRSTLKRTTFIRVMEQEKKPTHNPQDWPR